MAARLLLVGDIHLGRTPSRLTDEHLTRLSLARGELGPAEAWRRSIELALAERVDAVLLAGDLVEAEDDFFEAYPLLKAGVKRLVGAGIDAIAVAGNHDVKVLPKLAREIEELVLLGAGGRWQSHVVRRAGEPVARVVGWSFHEAVQRTSPLATYPAAWTQGRFEDGAHDALPSVGLLHADLDQSASPYAPVRRAELASLGLAGWLVGHVHEPDRAGLAAPRPLGYLGSLAGLDPGEPGAHGPWLGTLDAAGLRVEQRALAPLRWQELRVPLDGLGAIDELDARVLSALKALHAELVPSLGGARLVGLRLTLVGESRLSSEALAARLADPSGPLAITDELDGIQYFVEHARDRSRAALELDELAREGDPVGLLARRLVALERGGERAEALLREARAALSALPELRHPALRVGELRDDELRELLVEVARAAIEGLLEQRGALSDLLARPVEEVGA